MQEEHVQYLLQAFRQLDRVEVPGIGIFSRVRVPARLDADLQVIYPPVERFELESAADAPGGDFLHFLQHRFQIEEQDAETVRRQISARLFQALEQDERVDITGVGTLRRNGGGRPVFESVTLDDVFITVPPIAAESSKQASETKPELADEPANPTQQAVPVPETVQPPAPKPENIAAQPSASARAARSPVEKLALVLLTTLLLFILTALIVFRRDITSALGLNGRNLELAGSEADLEADLLKGEGFMYVDAFGRVPAQGAPASGGVKGEPGQLVYHIIVGSEKGKAKASQRVSEWQAKGYEAVLLPGKKRDTYRVSIFQTTRLNECDRKLAELKLHSLVPYDTWTLKVQH